MGIPAEPGPGLFPLLVGVVLLLGFLGTGVEAFVSSSRVKVAWPTNVAGRRVLAVALSSAAYGLALPLLGHLISGSLLAFAVLHFMALRSWPVKISLSLGIGVGSYLLFGLLLGVPFPNGLIFEWWE